MKATKSMVLAAAISLILVAQVFAEGYTFKNYDNDPNLAMAFKHDPEYAPEPSLKSRTEAERYYLAYLEKDIPSFQRAKVYCQLGVMYTTTASRERGEDRDYKKAQKYFEKVLELEPERVGGATIRARTMLCSLPSFSRTEKIDRGLEVYEWICSLEEEKIRALWLPNRPGDTEMPDLNMKAMRNLVPSINKMVGKNTVERVTHMPNASILLGDIIKRFPNEAIAQYAHQKLEEAVTKVADETLDTLLQPTPLDNTQPPAFPKREDPPEPPPASPSVVKEAAPIPVSTPAQVCQKRSIWFHMLFLGALVLIGVTLVRIYLKHGRKKA